MSGMTLVIIGIVFIVIGLLLWIFFFLPGRMMHRKKEQQLIAEYMGEEQKVR